MYLYRRLESSKRFRQGYSTILSVTDQSRIGEKEVYFKKFGRPAVRKGGHHLVRRLCMACVFLEGLIPNVELSILVNLR